MSLVPIVEHLSADPAPQLCRKMERLATVFLRERPELILPEQLQSLATEKIVDGPVLHLDDLSEIRRFDQGTHACFYQERARLRADTGDFIASCGKTTDGYEEYCRDRLQLGSPQWLHPRELPNPLHLAEACWEDRDVREFLMHELKAGRLRSIHPHMGTLPVWELAYLLRRETGCPLSVIAPPPAVSKWVNDKVAFSSVVSRLFGQEYLPRTKSAWNTAMLAQSVKDMAEESEMIGLKLPNSSGGAGNYVLDAATFRGQTLHAVRDALQPALSQLGWDGNCELLIDCWETKALCSPSCQLWIPPESEGPPMVEGVFLQRIVGKKGVYMGSAVVQLPSALTQDIVDRSWLLASLFQRLGYVGRCSFDLILVGDSLERSRPEFIECNGRWGGTSLPMTLMNRLFGDWMQRPFATQVCTCPGLDRFTFQDLLHAWRDDLYDARSGRGHLVIINPGSILHQSNISVVAMADHWDEAERVIEEIPNRLREFIG